MEGDTKDGISNDTAIVKPVQTNFIQITFLVFLVIAIGALIYTTITIVKYKDLLINPIGYSMDKFGLKYCTCYDSENKIVPIKSINYNSSYDKYLPKEEYVYIENKLNLTGLYPSN